MGYSSSLRKYSEVWTIADQQFFVPSPQQQYCRIQPLVWTDKANTFATLCHQENVRTEAASSKIVASATGLLHSTGVHTTVVVA